MDVQVKALRSFEHDGRVVTRRSDAFFVPRFTYERLKARGLVQEWQDEPKKAPRKRSAKPDADTDFGDE